MPERAIRTITPEVARRLSIRRQRLSSPTASSSREGIMQLLRQLGCLQLDPINVVARSHLLVLWSRLGAYDVRDLDALLWQERRLFESWAHSASIVLTEDYPIHRVRMRTYATGDTPWERRVRMWMEENAALRQHILSRIRREGPLMSRDFEDRSKAAWHSSGWTGGRNVGRMLDFLWVRGRLLIGGRRGIQRRYDLPERVLPAWTPKERLSASQMVDRAAQRSLRALGIGTRNHIERHFVRRAYPGLSESLDRLGRQGRVERVRVEGGNGTTWRGMWYVHVEDLPILDGLVAGDSWEPRTTLLSPFDNLICNRERTQQLFGFVHRSEFYVPKGQRRHGFYAMPILHGDRLIGRVDPAMDRDRGRLVIHAAFAEPDAPAGRSVGREVRRSIEALAAFLGADSVEYRGHVPDVWRIALR